MRFWVAVALAALSLPSAVDAKKAPPRPPVVEGQTVQAPVAEGGFPYLLFIPKGYNESGADRWPPAVCATANLQIGAIYA